MWVVARIVYYEPEHTKVLLGVVRPLAASLRMRWGLERVIVRPHWKRGPHVDVAIDTPPELEDAVYEECCRFARAWLDLNSSEQLLDEADYLRRSTLLGQQEQEPGPYVPLYENNTIHRGVYDRPPVLELEALTDARDDFLASQLNGVCELAELALRHRGALYRRLMEMMCCLAQCTDHWPGSELPQGGIALGHLSFRAHAEAYRSFTSGFQELFGRFETALAAEAEAAVRRTCEEFARQTYFRATCPPLADWIGRLEQTKRRVMEIVREEHGRILATFGPGMEVLSRLAPDKHSVGPAHPPRTEFFEALQGERARRLFATREHITYRMLINFFYALLPVIAVSPRERVALCYTVANACERVLEVDWRHLFYRDEAESQAAGA